MTVLITGGTGFVGLATAEALAARGEALVLFGREPLPVAFRSAPWAGRIAALVEGDVRSAEDLARAFAAAAIDHVVHAAALTPDANRERAEPEQIGSVNLGGTLALLRAAAEQPAPPRRVLVLSSVAVYGFAPPAPDGLYHEDAPPPAPETLYGITKLAAEQAALRLGDLHGLDTRAVRLGPVFGPWEHHSGARDALSPHHQIARAARAGRPVLLPRPMLADWLYARDAGVALADVLLSPVLRSRVLNLGGGVVTDLPAWCALISESWPDFTWHIADDGGAPVGTETIRYGLRRDRAALSNGRLCDETGFRHRFSLAAAARDYLAWAEAFDPGEELS